METSDIISLASLLVAIGSGIHSWCNGKKLKKQQIQINEYTLSQNRRNEEKEKQALICANAFRTGNNGWRIRVFNNGEGTARNIRIVSDDIDKEKSGVTLRKESDSYPLLNKGDHFDIVMVLFEGHIKSPIVKFTWDDEFGNGRERMQALDLTF